MRCRSCFEICLERLTSRRSSTPERLPGAAAEDEPAVGQVGERVLERREVPTGEDVDRRAVGTGRPHPSPQHRRPRPLLRLGQEVEQDRQLGPVVELPGEQREWVDVEHRAELLLGEPEERHQPVRPVARAQKSWFSPAKTSDTEPSVKIWRIESVRRSAHERTRMLSGASGASGMVSVTTISSNGAVPRFSKAAPENTPWVAAAKTRVAPSSITVWAAARSVPAVSIMSSTSRAVLPFTSPMT